MTQLDPMLLEILACPEDKTPVKPADEGTIAKLNGLQGEGKLKDRGGAAVEQALDGGLVREDGKYLYPIVEGIPIMLVDRAIDLGEVSG